VRSAGGVVRRTEGIAASTYASGRTETMAAGAGVSVGRARANAGAESRLVSSVCGAGGLVARRGRAQAGDVAEDLLDDTALVIGGAGGVVGGGGVVVATEAGVGVCGHCERRMCVYVIDVIGCFGAWIEQLVREEY
jgi:hypothetical protein